MPPTRYVPGCDESLSMASLMEKTQPAALGVAATAPAETDVDIDPREVYFLIMHFLSAGPCRRTVGQFWNELLEHQLLPRRYHAWYSRSGAHCEDENDDGLSFPLSYNQLVERYSHIEKDHLLKLMKQVILSTTSISHDVIGGYKPNAADVPTLLGSGSYSLLESKRIMEDKLVNLPSGYLRWPHMQATQVHGLNLREIGGGFTKHHRAPSIRAACYAIAKPQTMVQKMQNIKKLRGHRNAVYCAIFDRSGRYVITGADDRLVKIWSTETAFCLVSCRGHEGDITDLAVSSNNFLVASASNDYIIRVWRLPDGAPVSVLQGHMGAVTAIAFSPRPGCSHHLLSSSDDGTCRIWDARLSQASLRMYVPKPSDHVLGKSDDLSSTSAPHDHRILCCAYNASGTVFVTGSSDTYARVWNACKSSNDESEQHIHEMDVLSGHENDVNYVQFSCCAMASKSSTIDNSKEDNISKFKNSWFIHHDNIVTCSRDGSAIIWIPRPRKSHGKNGRWIPAYHLKVPPPPMPPQSSRGGPRQRLLPTPRGVNMIVWSLDNRFVLAAIMDRRICVWNAVDGSLVHSLTGHSDSTYVLDVHPFNPRIAMSAGYDGRTIIWDIWEGTPIRTYEIGRFKLVDGKFSPDGTSIVLSDDVGQLYTLSTGQGESQKDAKYDQFFLGDYRPLIHDTHRNVLDQETQLIPYRRNIQDLLCDSSMIPYPEPYQSMYQKRRLGALGIEYTPSSAKLSVGPSDISGFQEYPIVPLLDLDRAIEPMPEFIDAMDWEPENEIPSDDNDSEYNVADEISSEGEQGLINNGFLDDPTSVEESDTEDSQKNGFRRSKRKKCRADVGFMTSSRLRIKKRHLDEHDITSSLSNRIRKSRRKKSTLSRSSKLRLLRPQRAAARYASNFFSENSTEDYEDSSESNLSVNESTAPCLRSQGGSDTSLYNLQQKPQRGNQISLDECKNVPTHLEIPGSQLNTGGRRKLILKFSVRDTHKSLVKTGTELGKQINLQNSSKAAPENSEKIRKHLGSQDPGTSFGGMNYLRPSKEIEENKVNETVHLREQCENVEDDMFAGCEDSKIKWGDVKACTSTCLRSGDSIIDGFFPGSNVCFDDTNDLGNNITLDKKPESGNGVKILVSQTLKHENKMAHGSDAELEVGTLQDFDSVKCKEHASECQNGSILFEQSSESEYKHRRVTFPVTFSGRPTKDHNEDLGPRECMIHEKGYEAIIEAVNEKFPSVCTYTNNDEEVKPIVRKIRIKSKMYGKNAGGIPKLSGSTTVDKWKSPECNSKSQYPSGNQNLNVEGSDENEGLRGDIAKHRNHNKLINFDAEFNGSSRLSSLQDSVLSSDSDNKLHAVHKVSKSYKGRTDLEGDAYPRVRIPEASIAGIHRTRSICRTEDTWEQNMGSEPLKVGESHGSIEPLEAVKLSMISRKQLLYKGCRSGAVSTIKLRSSRNQRENYCDNDTPCFEKRKPHQSLKKLSWLMLSEHEETLRYIPQKGDDVVYLRQGHQQYIECRSPSKVNLWGTLEGKPGAVEFCKVIDLTYSFSPGSGESCCDITLEFVDPSSILFEQKLKLALPELNDLPDFLVERSLYDASIKRNWTTRDKCRVWWKNPQGESGDWWHGRIVSMKQKSPEFPDSPWEKFVIRYKNESAGDIDHCPWELQDPKNPVKHPCIKEHIRAKLLSLISMLEESGSKSRDRYGVQKLKQLSRKQDFLNRFPVPLSFDVIQSRLSNNYYRNLEAVEHDFLVMRSNAQLYFEDDPEFTKKMKRLSVFFYETMSTFL